MSRRAASSVAHIMLFSFVCFFFVCFVFKYIIALKTVEQNLQTQLFFERNKQFIFIFGDIPHPLPLQHTNAMHPPFLQSDQRCSVVSLQQVVQCLLSDVFSTEKRASVCVCVRVQTIGVKSFFIEGRGAIPVSASYVDIFCSFFVCAFEAKQRHFTARSSGVLFESPDVSLDCIFIWRLTFSGGGVGGGERGLKLHFDFCQFYPPVSPLFLN